MYDAVKLQLKKEDIGDKYKWEAVFQRIYQVCDFKRFDGGFGYVDGLRVSVTENTVNIKGSLSKYFYGDNIMTLTLAHTKEAIKRLGKELNLPIDKADVMEVEIAENFEVDNPPELYISKMKSLGTSHPNRWESGTTYFPIIKGSMLRLYNKGKESRQRGKHRHKRESCPLPEGEKKNLLRYEMQFGRTKIRQVFGRRLKACDLYNKQIFWQFIAEWFGAYEDIGKISDRLFDIPFEQIKSTKDMEDWCICIANTVINLPNFIKEQLFKNRENPQDIDAQYHKRIQDRMKKALQHFEQQMGQSDLVIELNRKIEDYLTWKFTESPDAYDRN